MGTQEDMEQSDLARKESGQKESERQNLEQALATLQGFVMTLAEQAFAGACLLPRLQGVSVPL